jgi:hypothetical protein
LRVLAFIFYDTQSISCKFRTVKYITHITSIMSFIYDIW